ncbi:serine/threonine-protein kinase [Virgisporangium ochraceum]|uniref:serine/threonine-protein kinase n=1 Tax=Virgisporangium ochraceum TaxID=65505 RepID=UPI001943D036|nr:serine/threonine-protein kinase [Virgisporangium ochraceum]
MDAADMLGGRYRLVERLGEGGMSVVWRAWDEVLDRHVAVKLLSPRFVADPTFRQRVRAEAQAAARLAHPNIAGIFDYGESLRPGGERVPYIVMELLSGQTLAELLDDGPLPLSRVLKICAQIASGLAAAHEQDIVHRDVKPANVMILANGTAKVVDFGVAAVVGDLTEQGGVLFGTPAYVAPERLSGGAVVAGTDVYGLGVLLYRMLAGYMPWPAESTTQMLVAHMYTEPEPLPPLTGLPSDVIAACEACLLKEPADRPPAADVADILTAAAATISVDLTPVPVTRPGSRSGSRSGGRLLGAGSGAGPFGAGPFGARPFGARPFGGRGPRRRARLVTMAAAAIAVILVAAVAAANVGADDADRRTAGPSTGGEVPTAGQPTGSSSAGGSGVGGTAPPNATANTPPNGGAPLPNGALPPIGTQTPPAPVPGTPTTGPYNQPGPTETDPPDPQWQERSASEYGNSVTVRCVGEVAQIVAYNAAAGWNVTRVNPGPAEQVNIRFETGTSGRVTFKSRCNNGIPRINPDVAAP